MITREKTKYIVIHSSATPEGRVVMASEIRRWHMEERGFEDIGYHFVIGLHGNVEFGRKVDAWGAHTLGYNHNSVGICLVGGTDKWGASKDTITYDQERSLAALLQVLKAAYPGPRLSVTKT